MAKADQNSTKLLLQAGMIAGPLYIFLGILQILIRPGFDITRHDLSLMSNGDLGWIQILNFILSGLLVIFGAIGMNRVLKSGIGSRWAPLMVGLYGIGLIGAGIFKADPMNGFPPGTPETANAITSSGLMHFVSGSIGFIGLIAACFILGRRFSSLKQPGWAKFSKITGTLFFVSFVGIAVGSSKGGLVMTTVILAFTAAVILAWIWLTLVFHKIDERFL